MYFGGVNVHSEDKLKREFFYGVRFRQSNMQNSESSGCYFGWVKDRHPSPWRDCILRMADLRDFYFRQLQGITCSNQLIGCILHHKPGLLFFHAP